MTNENSVGESNPYSGPNWVYDMQGLPPSWLVKAEELNRAAQIIFQTVEDDFSKIQQYVTTLEEDPGTQLPHPQQPLLDVFVFLAALSVENLLKGILIRNNPQLVSEGKMRGTLITSHDLVQLANEAGFSLSENEQRLLSLGTSAIQSWGRYPISKNMGQLESSRRINVEIGEVYSELYSRLRGDLESDPLPKFKKP